LQVLVQETVACCSWTVALHWRPAATVLQLE
jgi:hypothetical protein